MDPDPRFVVAVVLAATVVLAAAVWVSMDRAAVPGPSVPLQSLSTGDCFRGTPAMTSSPVEKVGCVRRHDGRVVGRARLLDDDVTLGRPIADGAGRRACAAALQDGWPADDGTWWAAVPSWPDFVDGARVVVCGSPG